MNSGARRPIVISAEPFLLAVARALQGREQLGDGEVFRVIS